MVRRLSKDEAGKLWQIAGVRAAESLLPEFEERGLTRIPLPDMDVRKGIRMNGYIKRQRDAYNAVQDVWAEVSDGLKKNDEATPQAKQLFYRQSILAAAFYAGDESLADEYFTPELESDFLEEIERQSD